MEEEKTLHHVYMQCMKNQTPTLGTHTVDGCGEFLPDNHTGLHCSACGCHRSFHRKISAPTATENQEKEDHKSTRRARTKFTEEQKEKMGRFAERIGWRIPKREREEEEMEVESFLEEAGVSRRAFKVWMHNHRNNNANCVAGQGQQGSAAAADSSGTDGTETDDVSVLAISASGYSY